MGGLIIGMGRLAESRNNGIMGTLGISKGFGGRCR